MAQPNPKKPWQNPGSAVIAPEPWEKQRTPVAEVQPTPPSPFLNRTGEELYNAELQKQRDMELRVGGATNAPNSLEQQIEQNRQKAIEQQEVLKKKQSFERAAESSAAGTFNREMRGADAATTASLSAGREGPQSAGNVKALTGYRGILQQQRDDFARKIEANDFARTQEQKKLDEAIASGNAQLAQQIRNNLVNLEQEQSRLNTAALDTAARYSEEARLADKQKFDNLDTFKGFLTEGISLPPAFIASFAEQSNLPADMLIAANAGAQAIRDDKTLSTEEKAVKLQQAQIDLDRKIKGLDDEAARKVDYLQRLRKSGASEEDIRAYKQVAGITDEKDPMYQAELRIKNADAQLKQMQANGEVPYGSTEWIERQQKALQLAADQKEFANTYGSEYDPTIFKIGEEVGWCGEYASSLSTAPKVGDTWAQKSAKIEDKNVSVGDKLLMPLGGKNGYGHVAVVLGYDPATGNIRVAESNRDGRQNKGSGLGIATFGVYNVNQLNAEYGDDWGVAHGELKSAYKNTTGVESGKQASALAQVPKELRTAVTQKAGQFDSEQNIKTFQTIQTMRSKANSVSDETTNPQDDQLLVYTFAKAMDPTSAVREGEYDTIQGFAQTALQRFGVNAERFYSNAPFLTKEARQNIKKSIEKTYNAEAESYDNVRNGYIKAIDNIAGKPVGEKLLQDYKISTAPKIDVSATLDKFLDDTEDLAKEFGF